MVRKEKAIMLMIALSISFLAGLFTPVMYETGINRLDSLRGDSPTNTYGGDTKQAIPLTSITSTPETPMNTWMEGQTIKVNHSFGSRIPSPDQSYWRDHYSYTESEGRGLAYSFANMYKDDSNSLIVSGGSDIESESFYDLYQIVIDLGIQAPRKGTIYFRGDETLSQATWKTANYPQLQIVKPDSSVTTWVLDGDLETGDLSEYLQPDGKIYALLWLGWDSNAVAAYHYARAEIKYFEVVFDDLIEYPRSFYKYSDPDTIQTKLSVWNSITSDLTLNLPSDWELSSISPAVDYSIDSNNDLTITDALGNTEFSFFFTKNSSKQYLAISEDPDRQYGFEGSIPSEIVNHENPTYAYVDASINSSIVYSGAFSLRLEASGLDYLKIHMDDSLTKNFQYDGYLAIHLYSESGTTWSLDYYVDGNWINPKLDLDHGVTDRWVTTFHYLKLKAENDWMYITGNGGVAFIELEFFQVNNKAYTSAYQELTVECETISWDGYSNPSLTNFDYELSLRDRTANTEILSTTVTTDYTGKASWVVDTSSYSALQDQRDIEVRSWSWESLWNSGLHEEDEWTESTTGWGHGQWGSISFNQDSTYVKTGSYSIRLDIVGNGGSGGYVYQNWYSAQKDLTLIDYFVYDYIANETESFLDNYGMKVRCYNPTSTERQWNVNKLYSITTSWQKMKWDMDSNIYFNHADFDFTSIGYFYPFMLTDVNADFFSLYIDSLGFIQAQKSYFTPIISTDSAYEYAENNEWDWSEETSDGWFAKAGETIGYSDGYFTVEASTSYDGMKYTFSTPPDMTTFDRVIFRIKSNITQTYQVWFTSPAEADPYKSFSLTADTWTIVDSTLTSNTGQTDITNVVIESKNWNTAFKLTVDFFQMIHRDTPSLSVADSYAYMSSQNNSMAYHVEIDNEHQGDYTDLEPFLLNLTESKEYTINATTIFDWNRDLVFLPSSHIGSYTVVDSGIMKIIIHDQSGNVKPFDSFKVYVDSVRLYDNYLFFTDTSQTFNLTITDLFDNLLYQDTTEAFENFKEIQITLYSVKLQNLQENPIWLEITRDSKTFSEWVFSYEIVKYSLETATYGFKIYYCDSVSGDLGALSTNGSWVNFNYAVSSDSALMVTGETIKDVFDNVISLTSDLTAVNASLSNQIVDVDVHISNVNTSIANQIVTVDIFIENMNTSLGTQLISLETDILNVNSTIYTQTIEILSDLANVNSTIYAQTVSILTAISNVNATLYAQNVNILSNLVNVNSTLHTQLITILTDLAELQGIFTVHFDFIDGLGIGIPWETFKLNVNDSRQYSQDLYVSNQTLLRLETLDFFNVSLTEANYTINQSVDIAVISDIYELIFRNNNTEFSAIVNITRSTQTLSLTIPVESTISHRFTQGTYSFETFYVVEEEFSDIQNPDNFTEGIHSLSSGSMVISSSLKVLGETKDSNVLDVGGPTPELTPKGLVIDWLTASSFLLQVLGVIIGVVLGYIIRTRAVEPIDKKIGFEWGKERIQDPTVKGSSKIMDQIPGFDPEKRRKTKDKRKTKDMRRK